MGEVFSFTINGATTFNIGALYSKQHMAATWANRFKDFIVGDDIDALLECIDDDGGDYVLFASESSGISKTWRRESVAKFRDISRVFRGLVSFTSYFLFVRVGTNKLVGRLAETCIDQSLYTGVNRLLPFPLYFLPR